jgi:hypothetical protein
MVRLRELIGTGAPSNAVEFTVVDADGQIVSRPGAHWPDDNARVSRRGMQRVAPNRGPIPWSAFMYQSRRTA